MGKCNHHINLETAGNTRLIKTRDPRIRRRKKKGEMEVRASNIEVLLGCTEAVQLSMKTARFCSKLIYGNFHCTQQST